MEVIEQMTYLLFIKRLDELQTVKEKKANRTKAPVEDPIFNSRQQTLRWSQFKSLGDPAAMYAGVADGVDRTRVVWGKSVYVSVARGGRRFLYKQTQT